MKIITNTTLVEKRAKWARRIAPATMLFLVAGLISNFLSMKQPQYLQLTVILLGVGFVSAIISSNLANNWIREPRADQVLEQLLKKFSNDYMLFNYTAPIPHVLIAPDGLYVFVVKNQDGQITVNGQRFSRKFTWLRLLRLLADEGMGAPVIEVENRMKKLHKLLSKEMADEEIPEIKPLILFSNKNLDLSVTDPAVPVMAANELKNYLRQKSKNRTVSATQRKKLAEILDTR